MAPATIREPLKSAELTHLDKPALREVYEYDVTTEAGQTYQFRSK